jgi:hypothetical protein
MFSSLCSCATPANWEHIFQNTFGTIKPQQNISLGAWLELACNLATQLLGESKNIPPFLLNAARSLIGENNRRTSLSRQISDIIQERNNFAHSPPIQDEVIAEEKCQLLQNFIDDFVAVFSPVFQSTLVSECKRTDTLSDGIFVYNTSVFRGATLQTITEPRAIRARIDYGTWCFLIGLDGSVVCLAPFWNAEYVTSLARREVFCARSISLKEGKFKLEGVTAQGNYCIKDLKIPSLPWIEAFKCWLERSAAGQVFNAPQPSTQTPSYIKPAAPHLETRAMDVFKPPPIAVLNGNCEIKASPRLSTPADEVEKIFHQAEQLHRAEKCHQARINYETAARNTTSIRMLVACGRRLGQLGFPGKTVSIFDDIFLHTKHTEELVLSSIDALVDSGHLRLAFQRSQRFHKQFPSWSFLEAKARSLEILHKNEHVDHFLPSKVFFFSKSFEQGRQELALGDAEIGIIHLRDAYQEDPHSLIIIRALFDAFLLSNDQTSADLALNQLRELNEEMTYIEVLQKILVEHFSKLFHTDVGGLQEPLRNTARSFLDALSCR